MVTENVSFQLSEAPIHREAARQNINPHDAEYHRLVYKVSTRGVTSTDRTGVGTTKLSGESIKFDLQRGFPLITSKYTWFKGVKEELLWFISGGTNIKPLVEKGVHIWDEWADENGDLGPVYGKQWRKWLGADGREYDQLGDAIYQIRANPHSRRTLVSAWKPDEIEHMALPPCHAMYQFIVKGGYLDCVMDQRSCDVFLGLPFNIASYATLTHLVAHNTNLTPGELTIHLGDVHVYSNHHNQVNQQLNNASYPPPKLEIVNGDSIKSIDDFSGENIQIEGYRHAGRIKAPIAV